MKKEENKKESKNIAVVNVAARRLLRDLEEKIDARKGPAPKLRNCAQLAPQTLDDDVLDTLSFSRSILQLML